MIPAMNPKVEKKKSIFFRRSWFFCRIKIQRTKIEMKNTLPKIDIGTLPIVANLLVSTFSQPCVIEHGGMMFL